MSTDTSPPEGVTRQDLRRNVDRAVDKCEEAIRSGVKEEGRPEGTAWLEAHARRLKALGDVADVLDQPETAATAARG